MANITPYMLQKWGPVTVGIDFTKQHGYKGGVIQAEDCGKDPHHAVLVVGYTKNFWVIKNLFTSLTKKVSSSFIIKSNILFFHL